MGILVKMMTVYEKIIFHQDTLFNGFTEYQGLFQNTNVHHFIPNFLYSLSSEQVNSYKDSIFHFQLSLQ